MFIDHYTTPLQSHNTARLWKFLSGIWAKKGSYLKWEAVKNTSQSLHGLKAVFLFFNMIPSLNWYYWSHIYHLFLALKIGILWIFNNSICCIMLKNKCRAKNVISLVYIGTSEDLCNFFKFWISLRKFKKYLKNWFKVLETPNLDNFSVTQYCNNVFEFVKHKQSYKYLSLTKESICYLKYLQNSSSFKNCQFFTFWCIFPTSEFHNSKTIWDR